MSKTCPSCNREVENEIVFCNFCGAFAGNEPVKADDAKVVTPKNIIIAVSVLIVLSAIMLFVFVFDIFGLNKQGTSELIGTGKPLFSMGLTPVSVQGKWGYADKEGNMVIVPSFENAFPFADEVNGLALVATILKDELLVPEDGSDIIRYGFIDEKGEYKISPSFLDAESFLRSGYAKVKGNNYVNTSGKTVFDDNKYTFISDFTDSGYSYAVFDTKSDGFEEGETIPINTSKAYHYLNEYYIIGRDLKEKFSFSDLNNEGIADVYDDYFVYFRYKEGHDEELISPREFALASYEDGKPVTEFYDRIYKSNDFYIFCTFDEESCLYKAKIYNKELNRFNGDYYIDSSFKTYDSGFVLYKKSGTRFVKVLLNDSFKEVCEENAEIKIISGFDKSGIACVKEKDNYAGYNADGKVFTCQYPFGKMNCGLAPFLADDGRIGYININGEIVLGAEYIAVSEFSADGYATVFKNGYYKIIDTTGKIIIDGLDYPINLIYGNNLDLKWYGNQSFDDNIKLMFDDGVFSVSAEGSAKAVGKKNIFGYEYNQRLYSKDGKLLSGEDALVSRYDSEKTGGALVAQIVGEGQNSYYEYKLMDKYGSVRVTDRYYTPCVPDENGIICLKEYVGSSADATVYSLVRNKGYTHANAMFYTEADDGYYLGIGLGHVANVYSKDMRQIAVFPCNTNAEIENGKVLFYRDVNYSFDWIPVDVIAPARSYYIYDYYNGRRVLRLDDSKSGMSDLTVAFTDNGFIFCDYVAGVSTDRILSPDGRQIAEGCDVVSGTYPDILLLKNQSDEKYYFIDRFGNKSEKYEFATDFSTDGYATVRKADGKYYCIDSYYNEIFSSDNQFMGFNNGLAPFYDEKSGFIGYMNLNGKTVIEPKFHAVSDFSYDGYAVAKDEYGAAYIINKKGETVIATDGFQGIEYARHINDNELNTYSRYSYENGYKYYQALDPETEKDKLFSYGLALIGGHDRYSGKMYLADVYGNIVYGPFYNMSGVETLPDGTPFFYNGQSYVGIDGKPIDYLVGYNSVYVIDENRIYANGDILDKNGKPIPITEKGFICRGEDVYGYLEMNRYWDDEENYRVTERVYLDKNNEEIREQGIISGNDLVAFYSDQGEYMLKSISSGEILFGGDSAFRVCGGTKTSCIITEENGVTDIYSYSKEKGLVKVIENVLSHVELNEDYYYRLDYGNMLSDEKTVYFELTFDLNEQYHEYMNYGMLVCDLEKGTVNLVENFYPMQAEVVNGKPVWTGSYSGDDSSYYIDHQLTKHNDYPYASLYEATDGYINGFKIKCEGRSDHLSYVREDGKTVGYFSDAQPFCSDGYATASPIGVRRGYTVIDKSCSIIY